MHSRMMQRAKFYQASIIHSAAECKNNDYENIGRRSSWACYHFLVHVGVRDYVIKFIERYPAVSVFVVI